MVGRKSREDEESCVPVASPVLEAKVGKNAQGQV